MFENVPHCSQSKCKDSKTNTSQEEFQEFTQLKYLEDSEYWFPCLFHLYDTCKHQIDHVS